MCKKLNSLVLLILATIGQVSYAGLVAYWDLEEGSGATTTAAVASPDADGTFVGATWITTGLPPVGGSTAAVFFNAANADRIETHYPGVLGQAARSVTAWIRAEPTQNQNGVLIGWGVNSPTQRYSFRLNKSAANGALYALRLEIQGSYAIARTALNDGQWHHVAVTQAGGATINQVSFYVDGQPEGTLSGTSGGAVIDTASSSVVLGNSGHATATYGYDGALDEIRVYDHVLSEAEIKALALRPRAYNPNPADGAMNPNQWVNLAWSAGDLAVSHDVYLGDNFADVNAGTADTFRGNQTMTSLLVGLLGGPYPDGLVPGTTYYWRVDEVNNANPNSPWRGSVWSFSIPPRTAYRPTPADGTGSVALDAKLTWVEGLGAKLHTVYFGDNFDDVNSAVSGGSLVGVAAYSPAAMKPAKVYYWRIDETDPPNTYKGQVWSFATTGAVGNPYPANDAGDIPMNAILSWVPGDDAASHQVYFGTDKEAVRKATTSSPEYKGVRALGAESYDPGLLPWDSTHYWRIDEVNATNPESPWKGLVWGFTTGGSLVVDDIESYNDLPETDAGSNRIYLKWIDGYGTTTNGAVVGNLDVPLTQRTNVHGGAQAMPLSYDNNLKFSEATLTLTGAASDWTRQGVTELSLWFRGVGTNAPERMYVVLNGTAVVYNEDASLTRRTGWTPWVIPLKAFADQGVNLTNVTSITIGFGTRGNTTVAGGTGQMYFDDIRLYRPKVMP